MANLPLSQVKAMQAQGMDNNQIIQALQRDGYNATQVFEALNQISLQPTMPGDKTIGETKMNQPTNYPPRPAPAPIPSPTPMQGSGTAVEEMVEAIIDEKWNELVKDINTIVEWKNQAQNTIITIEQEFKDLKDQFDKLHQALIAKIGEYDKNILDVGAEVKAMEKVFSKVLPVFTQNVAELSKITHDLRGPRQE